jgi:hypothetical protein
MNEAVIDWCGEAGLEVTRAHAYRKNEESRQPRTVVDHLALVVSNS